MGIRTGRTLLICTAIAIGIADARSAAYDWREYARFRQSIDEGNRRGDFGAAVQSAEDCLARLAGPSTGAGKGAYPFFCAYYLSSALRKGKGIPRDQRRAFDLLSSLAASNWDDAVALDLAEMHLEGEGTTRNPTEAAVLAWRVEHGAFSFYSDYWGMCNDCGALWAREKNLDERLQLTTGERQQADMLVIDRFPDVVARVRQRDELLMQIKIGAASLIALIAGIAWWRGRRPKRLIPTSS